MAKIGPIIEGYVEVNTGITPSDVKVVDKALVSLEVDSEEHHAMGFQCSFVIYICMD